MDKFTKKEIKDLRAIYAKAAAFEKKGMLAEAARSYRLFLSKWPEPTAYYNYAIVLKKMQDLDGALQNYENAIALKPDYAEAYGNIGSIHMERAAYEKALEQYGNAIRHNPALVAAYYNQGVALQKLRRPDEALAAYHKTIMLNPQYYLAYLNAGSIYLEKAEFGKCLELFDTAILLQPMAVEAYCNRGVALQRLRRYDDALADYHRALKLRPNYAEAYGYIGNVHLERGAYQDALNAFDQAIHHNPVSVEAYYNRGVALQELRRHEEALADNDKALALDPQHYLAFLNKAVILSELKRKAEAARHYRQILQTDSENHQAKFNLGLLTLSEGDFASGWKLYETRLKLHAESYRDVAQIPYWDGRESIDGKTIFIKSEQGFGDTIQFCRYVKLLKNAGANVVFAVQDPLRRLIGSLDEGIMLTGEDARPENLDYYGYLMSLPHLLGATLAAIPDPGKYLAVDPAGISQWQAKLDGGSAIKVGIVWAGGHRPHIMSARRNAADRSIGLRDFLPLLGVGGSEFFSLQKGPPAAQLAGLQAQYAIHDRTEELTDFADTGALIENLDLVITVDTSVAHLAAALGKPVWILLPFVSCWRWLENRTDTPWYSSVKLFRQEKRGNWDSVLAEVRQALEVFVAAKRNRLVPMTDPGGTV